MPSCFGRTKAFTVQLEKVFSINSLTKRFPVFSSDSYKMKHLVLQLQRKKDNSIEPS